MWARASAKSTRSPRNRHRSLRPAQGFVHDQLPACVSQQPTIHAQGLQNKWRKRRLQSPDTTPVESPFAVMIDGGPAPASHTPSCGSVRPRPGSDVVSSLRRGHATETWRRGLGNRPMLVAVKQSDESVWTESRPEWLAGVLPRASTWAVRRWLITHLGFGDTDYSASIPPRDSRNMSRTPRP